MQCKDKDLKFIFNWLEKQEVQNEDEIFLSSPATKNYWINKELCFFGNETVLRKLAIRSSVNRSTGFTPNMLMLGRENNGPFDLIFPGPDPDETSSYEQYVTDLVKKYTSCS